MTKTDLLEKTLKELDHIADLATDLILKEEEKNYLTYPKQFKMHAKHFRKKNAEDRAVFKKASLAGYAYILEHANLFSEALGIPEENFTVDVPYTQIEQAIVDKTPLQFCFGYTGDMMAVIYQHCVELYNNQDSDCISVLHFLITLNPSICWFWQLLGRAYQLHQDWIRSLHAFEIAIQLEPGNLECYQDAIKCCIQSENYKEGIAILDSALNFFKRSRAKKYQELKTNLEAMRAYCINCKGEEND